MYNTKRSISFSNHSIEKLVKRLIIYNLYGGPKQPSHQNILFLSRALFLLHSFQEYFSRQTKSRICK